MTIRELRDLSGMTQHEFAGYLEIPFRSIQNWEGGQRSAPEYVVKLVEYKLIKEGIIMTYAELKAEGVKIQESDENKYKLALEYTRLCLDFADCNITIKQKSIIKIRLNEIRSQLGMELI